MSERTDPDAEAGQDPPAGDSHEHGLVSDAAAAIHQVPDLGDEPVVDEPLVQEELTGGAIPIDQRLRDRRTQLSIIIPIFVLLLFAVALPGFQLDQLIAYIVAADPIWLVAAFVIYYLGFPLRGYRWTLLLRGIGAQVGVRDSTEIIFVSWLVNSVVPAKLGDVYRAWLLKINFPVSLSATFGTIFIERIFDLFAIVILGLGAAFWSFRDGLSDAVRVIMGLGVAVVVLLSVALFSMRNFGRRILERLPLPDRVVGLYDRFEEGVFSVDRRTLPIVAFLTVPDLDDRGDAPPVRRASARLRHPHRHQWRVLRRPRRVLLTAVPFTPAGLGIVEAGIVGILTVIYGADATEAASIAVVDRAISVLSVIVLGLFAYMLSPKTKGNRTAADDRQESAATTAEG